MSELKIPGNQDWTFETDRLLLTPMFESDADALFELLQEPELHFFTRGATACNGSRRSGKDSPMGKSPLGPAR